MSRSSSSFATVTTPLSKRQYGSDGLRDSSWSWRRQTDDHLTYSSSPRSSSPPRTPASARYSYGYAYIRSSPEIVPDTNLRGSSEQFEDPALPWDRRHSSYGAFHPSKSSYTAVPLKSSNTYLSELPPSSDLDPSEFSEDLDHDAHDIDSEHTSDSAPCTSSAPFSDSEEEDSAAQDDDDFDFGTLGYRTTFFRTSAERGQWRSDPTALKVGSIPSLRRSAPTLSRVATPTLPSASRTTSAPAVLNSKSSQHPDNGQNPETELPSSFDESPFDPRVESPHTIPSLTSDRESSPDVDDQEGLPSPLPPSSPPLSPTFFTVSLPSSPLASPISSPVLRSSSPLSEISLLEEEEDQSCHAAKDGEDSHELSIGEATNAIDSAPLSSSVPGKIVSPPALCDPPSITQSTGHSVDELPIKPLVIPTPILSNTSVESGDKEAENQSSASKSAPLLPHVSGRDSVGTSRDPISNPASIPMEITIISAEDQMDVDKVTSSSIHGGDVVSDNSNSQQLKDKNGVERMAVKKAIASTQISPPDSVEGQQSTSKDIEKRKKHASSEAGPAKKRRRTDSSDEASVVDCTTVSTSIKEEAENDSPEASVPKSRKKRSEKNGDSKAKGKRGKARQSSKAIQDSDDEGGDSICDNFPPLDATATALHAEVCGLLIETMAMSRASSMPVSLMYKTLMRNHPAMTDRQSEKEWLYIFNRVLRDGEAGRGSGVFAKVESNGKDDADHQVEARWFYVPELDEDQDRATVIKALMPRPAKRTETKKYKRYYWRPLDKMSKWDPEDDL